MREKRSWSRRTKWILTAAVLTVLVYFIVLTVRMLLPVDEEGILQAGRQYFQSYLQECQRKEQESDSPVKAVLRARAVWLAAKEGNSGIVVGSYDLTAASSHESETVEVHYMMRLRRSFWGGYSLEEAGGNLSTQGMELLSSSSSSYVVGALPEDYRCEIREEKVMLTYNGGDSWTATPVPVRAMEGLEGRGALDPESCYLSPQRTVLISGGFEEYPLTVWTTTDLGQSWESTVLKELPAQWGVRKKLVGFFSDTGGWLVAAGNRTMSWEEHRIFITQDGGRSWKEIGNALEQESSLVTGAAFVSPQVGFLGFRPADNEQPFLLRTGDGGASWQRIELELPEEYQGCFRLPSSPEFLRTDPLNGMVLVEQDENGDLGFGIKARFLTSDGGVTWRFDQLQDDSLKR